MDRNPSRNMKGVRSIRCFAALSVLWVLLYIGCNGDPPIAEKAPAKAKPAPAYEGRIVAVGDSLTAGLGVPEEMAYPALLESKLQSAGYSFEVINAGVSGETSSGVRSRIEWVIASLKPDIVILETGANDGLRGVDPSVLEENLDWISSELKKNNIKVLLAGMQMLPNLGPEYTKQFSIIYPKIATQHQLVFMPFFLKDVAGVPHLNQPDRIHPTSQGYEIIADNIYPYVLLSIDRFRDNKGP